MAFSPVATQVTEHDVLPGVEVKQKAWNEDPIAHCTRPKDCMDLSNSDDRRKTVMSGLMALGRFLLAAFHLLMMLIFHDLTRAQSGDFHADFVGIGIRTQWCSGQSASQGRSGSCRRKAKSSNFSPPATEMYAGLWVNTGQIMRSKVMQWFIENKWTQESSPSMLVRLACVCHKRIMLVSRIWFGSEVWFARTYHVSCCITLLHSHSSFCPSGSGCWRAYSFVPYMSMTMYSIQTMDDTVNNVNIIW